MGLFENIIGSISPKWAAARALDRQRSKLLADGNPPLGSNYGPYAGAQSTRLSNPWFISTKSPQFRFASLAALRSMRDRARTLERNNELANALLTRTVDNVIGARGFQVQATSQNPAWTEEHNRQWSDKAEKLFNDWTDNADITGLPWVEHQKVVLRSVLRDGDVGVLLDNDGYLQGVEADLIKDPGNENDPKGKKPDDVIFGIKVDKFNRPVGFYVDSILDDDGADPTGPELIPPEDFIFVANLTRFSQLRGETVFATVFNLLDQISQWKEAALISAKIAACFGLAIIKQNKAGIYNNTALNTAGQQQPLMNVEPGMVQYLDPGDSIQTLSPGNPGPDFGQNLNTMVTLLGMPFGLPREMLMLDFNKSYTASRAAMLLAQRKFQSWQQFFIGKYLKRVYQWRISKWIKAGELEDNPDAWNHKWITAPFPMLDPVKEMQYLQMAFDMNIDNATSYLASQGKSFDVQTAKRGKELKEMIAAGITPLHSQSLATFGPSPQTSPARSVDPAEQQNEDDEQLEDQASEDDPNELEDDND